MENILNRACLTGILVLLLVRLFAQTPANGFTVTGHIKGITSGTAKLLSHRVFATSKVIDSAVITNGTFKIAGKLPDPEVVALMIEPGHWSYSFILTNNDLTLNIDTTDTTHYMRTNGKGVGGYLKNVDVVGSQNQADYLKYENDPELAKHALAYDAFLKRYQAIDDEDKKLKMQAEGDSLRALTGAREKHILDSIIAIHPASVGAIYSYKDYYDMHFLMPIAELDSTLSKFKGLATQTIYYNSLKIESANRHAVTPGNIAPDFTLLKPDGSKFTLSATRGKYMMIDFWASWCIPCRAAIPHWKEVYTKYHDKGFDIVSISDDNQRNAWIAAMDKEKMPWLQVDDEFPIKYAPARVGLLYETHFIPFYVLLDKDGKILVYTDDEKDIDGKLAELLGK